MRRNFQQRYVPQTKGDHQYQVFSITNLTSYEKDFLPHMAARTRTERGTHTRVALNLVQSTGILCVIEVVIFKKNQHMSIHFVIDIPILQKLHWKFSHSGTDLSFQLTFYIAS